MSRTYFVQKTTLLLILFIVVGFSSFATNNGSIKGKVTDIDTNEGLPFVNVIIIVAGEIVGAQADFDGYYYFNKVPAGTYDIEVNCVGYTSQIIQGVLVTADKTTFLDIRMDTTSEIFCCETICGWYEIPLIEMDNTSTGRTFARKDIFNLPYSR